MPDTLEPRSFSRVLRDAIDDFAKRGFVDEVQVNHWLGLLRKAAERDLGPETRIDEEARRSLEAVFRRAVEGGRVVERVPEIGRYTLNMIAPRLRLELDRRILASADLIKLRRRETIEKTLRRFAGWTSSVPPGGRGVIDKRGVRSNLCEDMQRARWEKRRVEIDQGAKLMANIADVAARGNGAIAVIWHSNWRQRGYDYRPDHKERDLQVYALKDSWAIQQGLIRKGPAGYYEDVTAFGQEVFCRCFGQWLLSPRRLPEDMLTAKGRAWIAAQRAA